MTPIRKFLQTLVGACFGGADQRRFNVGIFLVALFIYLPGIWWGLPPGNSAEASFPWGSDELAPLGALGELYRVFLAPHLTFNPQYPLLQYMVQAVFVVPYIGFLTLTGMASGISAEFPFGFTNPESVLPVTTVLSRLPSTLMAAGTVLAAGQVGRIFWDERAARLTAIVSMLGYGMFYYSRTSNVDMPALFWTAVGIAVYARIVRDGLTTRRAISFGLLAALATGSKDASFFAFLIMAPGLIPWRQLGSMPRTDQWGKIWKPLLIGSVVSAAGYAFASGFVFRPARFFEHVDFILNSTMAFTYPATFAGTLSLIRELVSNIWMALTTPVLILAVVGVVRGAVADRRVLLLLLPGIGTTVATILPVHFVNFRFILIPAFCLSLVAGYGLHWLVETARTRRAWLAPATLVLGLSWPAVRGLDLTYQMIRDSRYEVAGWFAREARVGDTVAYFGAPQKLPALGNGILPVAAGGWCSEEDWNRERPAFVIVAPQQDFELTHEWNMADHVYDGMVDGSLGYERVLYAQTRALFSRRPIPFVNPPVQVFVRTDRKTSSMESGAERTVPVFAAVENALGFQERFPAGLEHNPDRAPLPCAELAAPPLGR